MSQCVLVAVCLVKLTHMKGGNLEGAQNVNLNLLTSSDRQTDLLQKWEMVWGEWTKY